jgi:hypothetical protein
MKRSLEDRDRRKQITWQQELQDLPAAVGKLEIAEGPAGADHEYVAGYVVAYGDLLTCLDRNEALPIRMPIYYRFVNEPSEQCTTKSGVAIGTGDAKRRRIHSKYFA